MKYRWRIFPVIVAVSICLMCITFIEKISPLSVFPIKKLEFVEERVELIVENHKNFEDKQNTTKAVDLIELRSEIQNGKTEMGRREKLQKLDQYSRDTFIKKMSYNFTESMMDSVLQSIRLELLKELYGTTFDQLMEFALQSKPLQSRPRPRSMQIVIATTWRSGSTFLEELLESHPGVYNVYEPLMPFGMKNFYHEKENDAKEAQHVIGELLHCRYDKEYLRDTKLVTVELFSRNKRVWEACKNKVNHNALCFQKKFLEAACKIFPWSVMKLVRIGVRFLKPFLEDKNLNLKVIYLVRDPRAVFNSRLSSVDWCYTDLCNVPEIHCEHMKADYQAVLEYSKLYPNRVHVLRYEDLALSPMNVTKDLLKKLNLDFDPEMENFIKSHTTVEFDKPWSTSRESSKRVTHWVPKIKQSTLDKVQSACKSVMPLFGYKSIKTANNASVEDILQKITL